MRNGWFDEQNRVFIIYQISEIQEDLGFFKRKAMDYLAELERFGLVEKKKRGFGLSNVLYIKSFLIQRDCSRSTEMRTYGTKITEARSAEIDTSKGTKMGPIKNYINNNQTDMSNTKSNYIVSAGADDQMRLDDDTMNLISAYESLIKENIDYNGLLMATSIMLK